MASHKNMKYQYKICRRQPYQIPPYSQRGVEAGWFAKKVLKLDSGLKPAPEVFDSGIAGTT